MHTISWILLMKWNDNVDFVTILVHIIMTLAAHWTCTAKQHLVTETPKEKEKMIFQNFNITEYIHPKLTFFIYCDDHYSHLVQHTEIKYLPRLLNLLSAPKTMGKIQEEINTIAAWQFFSLKQHIPFSRQKSHISQFEVLVSPNQRNESIEGVCDLVKKTWKQLLQSNRHAFQNQSGEDLLQFYTQQLVQYVTLLFKLSRSNQGCMGDLFHPPWDWPVYEGFISSTARQQADQCMECNQW